MLVSGERASEHDSFNGACSAKIVTPAPGDGALAGGGVAAGERRVQEDIQYEQSKRVHVRVA